MNKGFDKGRKYGKIEERTKGRRRRKMKKLKLEEILEGIEDSRRENSVQYPLHEVLFIMIIAIMCGATSYVKIEMFGKSRQEWFAKYLKLKNGIPDALTFRKILIMITPSKMHELFAEWMKNSCFKFERCSCH